MNVQNFCKKPLRDNFIRLSSGEQDLFNAASNLCLYEKIGNQQLARLVSNYYKTRNVSLQTEYGLRAIEISIVLLENIGAHNKAKIHGKILDPAIDIVNYPRLLIQTQNGPIYMIIFSITKNQIIVKQNGVKVSSSDDILGVKTYFDLELGHENNTVKSIYFQNSEKSTILLYTSKIGFIYNHDICVDCIRFFENFMGYNIDKPEDRATLQKIMDDILSDEGWLAYLHLKSMKMPSESECNECESFFMKYGLSVNDQSDKARIKRYYDRIMSE